MDFALFVNTLLTGTPVAILAAAVGLIWQAWYVRSRDKLQDQQMKRELNLEEQKFRHDKELEELRFQYEQRRWRESLGKELILQLLAERIESFARLWQIMEGVSTSKTKVTRDNTRAIAGEVLKWRYSKGGLLAEDVTRNAVFAFQQALWDYDGSREKYHVMRRTRKLVLISMRADIGLGEDISGQSIYKIAEKRQNIGSELAKIQDELGIKKDTV
jgi:hypothetical protein